MHAEKRRRCWPARDFQRFFTSFADLVANMQYTPFSLILAALCAALSQTANAADSRALTQLQSLNDVDQLDQRCDLEGMERLKADKVISYTFSNPVRSDTTVTATGAVFRQGGEWYHLSYACTTSQDHMQIVSFDYKIGARIPHEEWTRLYLYP